MSALFANTILLIIYSALTLVKVNIIIKYYGAEINSIFQVASQIFMYLVLFESGLNAAYLYKMYAPMNIKNYMKLNSLYLGLSQSLKKIAFRMFLMLIPVCILYAVLTNTKKINLLGTFLIIFLMGIRFIIPYYVSLSKKTLLIVYEYRYLVDALDGFINVCTIILEMLLVIVYKISLWSLLSVGIIMNVLGGSLYSFIVKKMCKESVGNTVVPSFEGESMTKDLIVHQVGSLVNNNIDILILSMYNLFSVSVYQAYNTLISYPIQYFNHVSETFRAIFGIKLVLEDKKVYEMFQVLMVVHVFAAMVIAPVFLTTSSIFVQCWIGKEYILKNVDICLFGLLLIHRLLINPIYIIRDGRGMYHESKWYTMIQSIINLVLSLILIVPFGITGLLLGTVIATFCFCAPCNYYLVYCKIFHRNMMIYIDYFFIFLSTILSVVISNYILGKHLEMGWFICIKNVCLQTIIAVVIGASILVLYKGKYCILLIKKWRNS